MKYENQNDYSNVPYPSPTLPNATVKSGGCGVCSCVNVLRFFGVNFAVADLAKVFVAEKIRVDGGTEMSLAAKYICDHFALTYTNTSDETELIKALQKGSCAIANVGGDRPGYKGIFSTEGHYINVIGYDNIPPKPFILYDCGYYDGKYGDNYRKGYVSTFKDKAANLCLYASATALNSDTANRTPNYYIFEKKVDPTVHNMLTDGIITKENVQYWDDAITGKRPLNPEFVKTILDRYHALI